MESLLEQRLEGCTFQTTTRTLGREFSPSLYTLNIWLVEMLKKRLLEFKVNGDVAGVKAALRSHPHTNVVCSNHLGETETALVPHQWYG